MLGSTILHYQILEKIGAGGMGEIYKARDTRLNRFVAIKVLSQNIAREDDRRRRFYQEAQAASALNHPNIITIYDIIPDGPVECIVMEYVAGRTLAELTPANGMSPVLVLRLGMQIASALSVAHTAGIVHRDLKPGNVMVTESALVKVLDFGLAKLMDSGPVGPTDDTRTVMGKPMTIEGSIIGTVSYMSPEQAQGKKIDARTDIFSFGAVLYEMTTGQRAFGGENALSTLTAVLRDEARPVADFVPNAPPEFDQIIRRCLRKNPADRFQSVLEVESALSSLKQSYDSGSIGAAATASAIPVPRTFVPPTATPSEAITSGIYQQGFGAPPSTQPQQPVPSYAPFVQPRNPASDVYIPPQSGQPASGQQLSGQPTSGQQPGLPPQSGYGQQPGYQQPSSQEQSAIAQPGGKKKSSAIPIVVGILVVLGVLVGGGWFMFKDKIAAMMRPPEVASQAPIPAAPAPSAPVPAAPESTQAPPPPTAGTPVGATPAPGVFPPGASDKGQVDKGQKGIAAKGTDSKAAAAKTPEVKPADQKPTDQKTAEVKPPVPAPPVSPAPVPPTVAATRPVPLPDGTPFTVILANDIAADAEEGLPLQFTAAEDLKAGGAVVLAKGSPVTGAILEGGKKKRVLGIGGKMTLRMLQAQTVDGRKINVRATSGARGDGPARRNVEVSGSRPKELAATKGTQYIAYVDGDVVVSVKQ